MKMTKHTLLILAALVLSSCTIGGNSNTTTSSSNGTSEDTSLPSSETDSSESTLSEEESLTSEESESQTSTEEDESSSEETPFSSEEEFSSEEIISSSEESLSSGEESSSSSESSQPATPEWIKVESVDDLVDGDRVILASSSFDAAAGEYNQSGYFAGTDAVCLEDYLDEVSEDVSIFTLGRNDSYWTIENEDGSYLGANGTSKSLGFDKGETNWNISISDGLATIASANTSYGRILYNATAGANRFANYTSKLTKSMVLPSLYHETDVDRIYPIDLSISGENVVSVGESTELSVTLLPEEANVKTIKWASEDGSIATVSGKGVVTGVSEGKTRISASAYSEAGKQDLTRYFEIEVKPVPVTGIELSEATKELKIGRGFTLEASVLPSNATNKNVTWSSSNETVATVSEGKVSAVAEGVTTITAKTEEGGFEATCEINVVATALDDWTIMLYICGSDLESQTESEAYGSGSSNPIGYASADIKEILANENQPDGVNILIETGGAKAWRKGTGFNIPSDKLARWHVRDQRLVQDAVLDNASMGETSTFQSFLEWGLTEYPAEKTGVILWNHGGAMSGVCYDENFDDDSLVNSEVQSALAGAFAKAERAAKLEFIGYDACLMAVQDIAYSNSKYFNYMVASEESEAGEGWDYTSWIDDVYAGTPTTTILKEICDGFIDAYDATYTAAGYDNDQTESYLDLSKIDAYYNAFENVAGELLSKVKSNKTAFTNMMKTVKTYADTWYSEDEYNELVNYYGYPSEWFTAEKEGKETYYLLHGYYMYATFDAMDFLNKIQANATFNNDYVAAAKEALAELIGYNRVGAQAGESHGLALVCPMTDMLDYNMNSHESSFTKWLKITSYMQSGR